MKKEQISLALETNQASLLKLVAHPVRIAILKIIRQEEACVCHMEAILGYRQAYLSQQLAILRQSNIIVDRRDGWNIYYQIQDKSILQLLDLSEKLVGPEKSKISSKPVRCPCPKCVLKNSEEPCCEETEKESVHAND
ncbi:MAG TPA: metalloregulator ArsR/SmtB family transcription factor [Anaerolineaceae bacterium]|nr:metalloregulator ArsR/SmtB family transcription factor [Anaerolineaceae bacterium]